MVTAQQLHLLNGLYLVVLVAVAILTRATARRLAGALAGAAAMYPGGRHGTRSDAAGRRSRAGKSVGPTAVGDRRTIRCS
jgi:hypothetical protein